MKESMPSYASAREQVAESVAAVKEKNERMLEAAEAARQYWTEALALLDEGVPHNDVVEEEKTLSFHVFRNTFLANINELCEQIEDIRGALARLKEMQRKETR